jgi:DNA invertase Pin-like site-specific DNA recombinase
MKTIGYIRVSTIMQAERGHSLAEQADRMKSFAHAKELDLVDIKSDEGISGSTIEKREGLKSALRMLDDNEVEALLIVKIDRLTRTLKDLLELVDLYFHSKSNYRLISMSDNIDTNTAMGRFGLNLLGSLAQLEREQTSERVSAVMQFKRRNMEHIGGLVPYGLKKCDDDPTHLEYDLDEMGAVRFMHDLRNAEPKGESYRKIAAQLATRGTYQRNGKPFDPKTIKRILDNFEKGFYDGFETTN